MKKTTINGKSYTLDTLYLDLGNLTSGGVEFFPKTMISQINLTESLSKKLGERIMEFLDPYRGKTTATRKASTEITEPTGMNVMALISLLIEEDSDGNYKYLHLPKRGESSEFYINLNNYAINTIASMFVGGMTRVEEDGEEPYYENGLGIDHVKLSLDFKNPLSSINLDLGVTENTNLNVSIGSKNADGTYNTGITYFVMPAGFDFSPIGLNEKFKVEDEATAEALRSAYKELSETLSYTAKVSGNLKIGSTGGTTINLDSLMGLVVDMVFKDLGLDKLLAEVDIDSSSELNIGYEIQLGTSLVNMSGKTNMAIDLYLLDSENNQIYEGIPFIEIYYRSDDDTVYVNTQVNAALDMTAQLNEHLPPSKIIKGNIPRLSLKNVGIKKLLSGVNLNVDGLYEFLGVMGKISLNVSNAGLKIGGLHNLDGDGKDSDTPTGGLDVMTLVGNAISKVTVERTLTDLVKSGYIAKVGAGPSTGYVRI